MFDAQQSFVTGKFLKCINLDLLICEISETSTKVQTMHVRKIYTNVDNL